MGEKEINLKTKTMEYLNPIAIIFMVVIFVIVLFIFRMFNMWYFGINEVVRELKKINGKLSKWDKK
jgi:hypothetical protein